MPTRTWDEADPADADLAKYGAQEIRELKVDISERMALEHYFTVGGTEGYHGVHKFPTVYKTTTYTAALNDTFILCDTAAGAWVLTLPPAATIAGKIFIIKKSSGDTNVLTIDGNASEIIDGITTYSLSAQNQFVALISNGTNWFIIATSTPTTYYQPVHLVSVMSTGNQTLTSSVYTKLTFSEVEVDPLNEYSTASNRFTPMKSGYYLVNAYSSFYRDTSEGSISMYIYKNGAAGNWGRATVPATASTHRPLSISGIISMNGSTDYLEMYAMVSGAQGYATLRGFTATLVGV